MSATKRCKCLVDSTLYETYCPDLPRSRHANRCNQVAGYRARTGAIDHPPCAAVPVFGEDLNIVGAGNPAYGPGIVWPNCCYTKKSTRNSRAAASAPLCAVPMFDQRLIATRAARACGRADRPDILRCNN